MASNQQRTSDSRDIKSRLLASIRDLEPYGPSSNVELQALRDALTELQKLEKRLAGINTLVCYASEENTEARYEALLHIGRVARGEEEVTWPTI